MQSTEELCGCGCGRAIELTEWGASGPDWKQPTGFYDDLCQRWFRTECGNRKRGLCEGCTAFKEAEALVALATSIRDNLTASNEKPAVALSALRDMIGVEAPLGRRLRRMIAKENGPQISLDSCDPKTCTECRLEVA